MHPTKQSPRLEAASGLPGGLAEIAVNESETLSPRTHSRGCDTIAEGASDAPAAPPRPSATRSLPSSASLIPNSNPRTNRRPAVQIELSPALMALMTDLQTSIHGLRAELASVHAELRSRPTAPAESRKWYSVEEVAALLGKRPYTIREWARHGQIHAVKRAERRGSAALWSISAEEVTRYKNEGLLGINPERNNSN